MTRRVEKIKYFGRVPYDTNKMVLINTPISQGLIATVSTDDLEIQRTDRQYDPLEVPFIQRASPNCDLKEKLQDDKDNDVDPTYMIITSCARDSTCPKDLFQIPIEESHNGSQK